MEIAPRMVSETCFPANRIIAEGFVEARSFEVLTKRKLVFAEASWKLAGGRVVFQKEVKQE